jgi:diguanylate cyclase (GGDEF)-like protein/PAS domain S-box-containing protein
MRITEDTETAVRNAGAATMPRGQGEASRLADLRACAVLDTPPEAAFDDIACLATRICAAPIAAITFVDSDRAWFKARIGIDAPYWARADAFCAQTISEDDVLVVADATSDERFRNSPIVTGAPYVRAYAGVPLRTPAGQAIGTLCVMDQQPRELSSDQIDALRTLARQATALLESRRAVAAQPVRETPGETPEHAELISFAHHLAEGAVNALASVDLESRFRVVNRRFCEMTGYSREELIGRPFDMLLSPAQVPGLTAVLAPVMGEGGPIDDGEIRLRHKDGRMIPVQFSVAPLIDNGRIVGAVGTVQDVTDRKQAEAMLLSQHHLLEMIAAGAPLAEILMATARTAEEQSNTTCSIMLLDDEGQRLHVAAAPTLPESLSQAFDGLLIGPSVGSCGTAAFRGAPVITRDVEADPFWADYRDIIRPYGLRSCWSTPIITTDRNVVGTFALYSPEPAAPDERQQRVIEIMTHLAAMAIEQSRSRDALAQSESRYRALAENAFDLVCELDGEGRFVYVSPNFERVLGYRRDELLGLVAFELIHDDDRPQVGAEFASAIANPNSGTISFRFRHNDGEWCWIESSANVFRTPSGETHAVIVSRDVGERMRMEETLRDSEARLRAFIENAPVALLGADRNGLITLFDGAVLDATGIDPDAILGRNVEDVLAVRPELLAAVRRAMAGEAFVAVVRMADRILEVHYRPMRGASGEVTGTICVGVDVTERERTQAALRQTETRLRAFVATAPVIMFGADVDGVITLNDGRALERIGLQSGELVGARFQDALAGNERALNNLERALGGEEFTDTIALGPRWFDATHRAVRDETGGVIGVTGILVEVTDRVRAEELIASQRELLEKIAVGTDLHEVLDRVALAVEKHARGAICTISLIDESDAGLELRRVASPSLPAPFRQATESAEFARLLSGPLDAAMRGEQFAITDTLIDPAWNAHRGLAMSVGLRSLFSTPIVSTTGRVLGTLVMYRSTPHEPTAREQVLASIATRVAGIAIERTRAEAAVRQRTAELERTYKRLVRAHAELEESKLALEEKSQLLELSLAAERERGRHDPLTGALNHAGITDVVRNAVADSDTRTLAMAMVDVDGLKIANDTFGHQVGDAVLVLVAQKLMRDGAIVGRYGGDEFVALLLGADRPAAEAYRQHVLKALAEARLIDEQSGAHVPVVASMGIAIYPDEAGAAEDLIRLSDSAMYASRRQRPEGEPGTALSRTLGGERAAKMVSEIVPLLTSPGDLADKLRHVAQRLSVGAGYDAVNFILENGDESDIASSAFARVPEDRLRDWNDRQRDHVNIEISQMLVRTRKPIVIEDLAVGDILPEHERNMLTEAGLRSALIAPMFWQDELIGALSVASRRVAAFSVRDADFLQSVATQVTAIVRMSSLVDDLQASSSRLRRAHEETVLMLASAAEAHDHTTGRHLERVRDISEALARELGYEEDAAHALGLAATLHDIGKIRVPDSVLGSSSSLAEAEWVLMKQHTLWGSAFLADQQGFELATSVARHHHERWDGAGYPDGLSGDEIPEGALITTVADSLDAMTSDRPYRAGRPVAEAVVEIMSCSGTQFSPRVVEALVRLYERGGLGFVHADDRDEDEHNHGEAITRAA